MTDLSYRLAVLTHGDSATLPRALEAFREHVTPLPRAVSILRDGPGPLPLPEWAAELTTTTRLVLPVARGFCAATAALWAHCAGCAEEYVVWLEHDFEVCRPLDLWQLVHCLEWHSSLAQIALMRDAYSQEEHTAGGLYELRRHDFEAVNHRDGSVWWLRTPWFTTNPSLMPRSFMAANPFPDDGVAHCEGRFGASLREKGYEFGTWGNGEVYTRHVGQRTGFGY